MSLDKGVISGKCYMCLIQEEKVARLEAELAEQRALVERLQQVLRRCPICGVDITPAETQEEGGE